MSDLTPLAAELVRAMEAAFPALEQLPAPEGRALAAQGRVNRAPAPDVADVRDLAVPGPGGPIPIRVYRPDATEATPLIVFFHGGGFVLGDLDGHDTLCRAMCLATGATVVSVDYRLAPEHPFPAAVDDAHAATAWVVDHAAELGGDPTRVAVAGDSAGATLATVTARRAQGTDSVPIRFQLLVYPGTDFGAETPSLERYARPGYFLGRALIDWFKAQYVPDRTLYTDPRVSPLHADDLSGMPPTHIVLAGCDPLRDEGLAYAERLREAGVDVDVRVYEGMFHGFVSFTGILPEADEATAAAFAAAASALRGGGGRSATTD